MKLRCVGVTWQNVFVIFGFDFFFIFLLTQTQQFLSISYHHFPSNISKGYRRKQIRLWYRFRHWHTFL